MALRVYNTLTQKKEDFQPVQPGKVGIYLCGPTVYKSSHIGHAIGPIIFDAIKRYLVHRGYETTWVVNITDVDDKIMIEAAEQGCSVDELAQRVTDEYLDALAKLNITSIDKMPKASEYIDRIVGFIQRIIDAGAAYESGGDVYFDVTAKADYGKLSNRSLDDQTGQRELQSGAKRHPGDFALWKAAKPEEPDEVKFDSPWGKGRPGWHIECSVMSTDILGETFDIHGGGMDLIFPHHENEIAQSEAATGRPYVKYWMHNGLTRFNTKKVSKSDPEMQAALAKMTLKNLLQEYDGELLRYFVLSTHYRRPIEYSPAEIESKRKGLTAIYRLFERVERVCGESPYGSAATIAELTGKEPNDAARQFAEDVKGFETRFIEAMDDDFNTAAAIATLFELNNKINSYIEAQGVEKTDGQAHRPVVLGATRQLVELGRILGLFSKPRTKSDGNGADAGLLNEVMQVVIDVRQACKKNKAYDLADLIRDRLKDAGVTLTDRPDGTTWAKE